MKFHSPHLCLLVLSCTPLLHAAESSIILKMPPGWAGFDLEATVETGFRPAGFSTPEMLTSDTQTATVSPTAGHLPDEVVAVPTALSSATPDSGDPKDKAEASLDLRYIIGNDVDHDTFEFDFSTTTSAVAAVVDFGSGPQKADAVARVTVVVRSTAPLLAADFPGAVFVLPDMPAVTDPTTESMVAFFRIPHAGREPETSTFYATPLVGFLTAGNPGVPIYLDILPATAAHGDETLDYTCTYEVVTPFGSDPMFNYSVSGSTGTTSTVVTNTNNSGPGSLRQALVDVPENGAITFAPDLDGETITLDSGQLSVSGRGLAIDASDLPNKVTVDAGGSTRVMRVTSGADVLIRNVTLTGGNAGGTGLDSRGGGIRVYDSTLALTDCSVLGNHAVGSGGGISGDHSSLRLVRTLVDGNSAEGSGGGIVTSRNEFSLAEVTLIDSEFRNNTAGVNGGAVTQDGPAYPDFQFTRCSFLDNHADERGGALYRVKDPIDHCTFHGNSAVIAGGAIYQVLATEIRHSTITGNTAPFDAGGGVYTAGTTTVFSSIIAGNTGTDVDVHPSAGSFSSAGFNVIGDGSGYGAFTSGGDTRGIINPLLSPPGDFGGPTTTLLPLLHSPATDAGATDLNSPNIDQRGFPRVADGNGDGSPVVDVGAAETEQVLIVVSNGNDSGPGSLRQAIADIPDGGLILFQSDVFSVTLSSGDLVISGKTFTIDGSEGFGIPRSHVPLYANESSRIFSINSGADVTIQGLRMMEGRPNSGFIAGGAIWNEATLSLIDCEISGCSSRDGGGIYNAAGAMATLLRCHISNNHASDIAGAIHNSGSLSLDNTTISGNVAPLGGGGLFLQSSAQATHLVGCTVANNFTIGTGGAIDVSGGLLDVRDSCFHGNVSRDRGGALACEPAANVVLQQATFWGNVAGNEGGAICGLDGPSGGTINLRHSTITRNHAPNGGAIFLATADPPGMAIRALSNIIAGNSDDDLGDLFGTVISDGGNVIGNGPGAMLFKGTGDQLGIGDPVLSPLGDYGHSSPTMLPLHGSPAMESGGMDPLSPSLDSRGQPRIQDGDGVGAALIDAGAAEVASPSTELHVINPNDSGPGSLRQAIADATIPGTRIVIDSAVDGKVLTLTTGALEVTGKSVFIDAGGLIKGVVISGNDTTSVLTIDGDGAAVLRKLIIQNGSTGSSGGGIYSRGSLSLASCRVKNCHAQIAGGGILHFPTRSSSIILDDSTVFGNEPLATSTMIGGGLFLERLSCGTFIDSWIGDNTANIGGGLRSSGDGSSATLTLRLCEVNDNQAETGAGISQAGSMILSSCNIEDNLATGRGGGMFSVSDNLQVLDSTFAGNRARDGGGIAAGLETQSPRIRVEQSTFFSNQADQYGGAIYLLRGDLNIDSCTISGNEAMASGGGIATIGTLSTVTRMGASIVSANTSPDLSVVLGPEDPYLSEGSSIIGQMAGTIAFGAPTFDQIGILDPLLSAPGAYGGPTQTMIPLPGSPARDSGPGIVPHPNTDQRGFPRIHGAGRDVGAYETSGNGGFPVWALETIPTGEDMTFTGHADDDANANGLEYGVGTDPDVSDPGSSNNPWGQPIGSDMVIDFGFRPEAFDVVWQVVRSTDLQNWTEIYQYDGVTETLEPDITATIDFAGRTITVEDADPPMPEAYYRLEVLYTP